MGIRKLKYLFCACSLIFSSSTWGQAPENCNLIFDFGYGNETYCDSNLWKAGYFNYNIFDRGKVIILGELNFSDSTEYADSIVTIQAGSKYLDINVHAEQQKKRFEILRLYSQGVKDSSFLPLILYNGYKISVSGKVFYLLFIRPSEISSNIVRYRGILVDISKKKLQVTPLPNFQSSNSVRCLTQICNNDLLGYISFDVFSDFGKNVFFYKYQDGKFFKDAHYYMSLIPEGGYLFKIDKSRTHWDLLCK